MNGDTREEEYLATQARTLATSGSSIGWRVAAGATFGVIGSIVLGMYAMIVALIEAGDFFMPLKAIAATFLGESAMQPGFPIVPILIGLMFHMMNGAWLGALFGLITPRLPLNLAIGAGAIFGIVESVGALWIMPAINPARAQMIGLNLHWIVEHALFGLVLGLYPLARSWGWFGAAHPAEDRYATA